MVRSRLLGLVAVAAIVAACNSGASSPSAAPAASAAATPAPAATASTAASASASTAAAASPSAAALPTVAADQLGTPGKLIVCSDTSYPPQEFLDNGQATGSDVDLITEIGKRLGLTVQIKTTVFDSIIPALVGGSCDVIVSAQTITANRQKQVDMIPYFAAGQSWVVAAGNPDNIKTLDDLCGKAVAAESGTVEAFHVTGTGDYKPADGLSQQCVAKGKAAITLKTFKEDTQALLALTANTVVAHFTDEPVAGYEVKQGNGKFELAPDAMTLERAPEGISVGKNHTGLRDAIKAALLATIADGTYTQILTKWNVQTGAITAADVNK